MTKIILGTDRDRFFLADFTPMQPIEAIIKLCYRQFHLPIPKDFTKWRLYEILADTILEVERGNYNVRWGDYPFSKDGELIFEP